eukprot:jgi/Picsp_1/5177/NSC_02540-R1_protein
MSHNAKLREALSAGGTGSGFKGKHAHPGSHGGDGVLTLSGQNSNYVVADSEDSDVLAQVYDPDSGHESEDDSYCSESASESESEGDSSVSVDSDDPPRGYERSRGVDLSDHEDVRENGNGGNHSTHDDSTPRCARPTIVDAIACSSSSYMDDAVTKSHDPHTLYGSFTWKVPNFRDVSKRELKSSAFSVGPYKWYILVYPNGCDVSNHLSLFLCVADYDKLLPGWSHFAQFTIAVVNKDPKKSKYSDTLHRFCKKEHDWGWKKFMELGKMADGFVDKDTLTIKVQVQVIKDRQTAPFRTLDSHYRRELIRVYLSNIEGIVRRFVEGKKQFVETLLSKGLTKYWEDLKVEEKKKLSFTQAAPLFKLFNKKFFNEKEVTSTLMMDAAYCGMKVLDLHYTKSTGTSKGKDESEEPESFKAYLKDLKCNIVLDSSKNIFLFENDALEELQKFVQNPSRLYPFEDRSNDGASSAKADNGKEIDLPRDIAERDELKLVDLARHILEVFAISHIAEHNIEKAWTEAEVIRRQEELIREEEEATKGEAERLAAKAEAERERRARKKERQRAKKEAERAKKEALEAEKAREEAKKRADQERKRQEAEEKRQQEEAKREAERQKQLEQKQAATVKKSANVSKPNVNIFEADSKKIATSGESTHGDSESLDESCSALTSARSDHSSLKGSKSKPATLQNTPRDGAIERELEAEKASSQNATSVSLIKMKQLLQSRDEEILVLQAKVKSLEEELERSQARIASLVSSGSTPTTPQRNTNKGIAPEDLGSIPTHHNSSPVAKQAIPQYVSGRANLSQMSGVGNPSEAILASALTRGNLKEGIQSKQPDIAQLPQVAGVVNYSRLGSQSSNSTRQSSLPSSTALPQGQQSLNPTSQYSSLSRNLSVYSKSEAPMPNKGPMSYRQYQPSQLQSGSQILPDRQNPRGDVPGTNINLNSSRAPVMSSMNGMTKLDAENRNSRYVQNPNGLGIAGGPQNAFTQQLHTDSAQQKAQIGNIGEASGLDDFAHLGLITDLLE